MHVRSAALAAGITTLLLQVGIAWGGLNPSTQARIHWQNGATGPALSGTDASTPIAQLVVTVSGLNDFRGADVQIQYSALGGARPLPDAWQFQDGGCASGSAQFYPGGRGGSTYPNAFNTSPAVPGLVVMQNQAMYATGDCLTPRNRGLLWLSAAGSAGAARNSTTEYAIWAITVDLRGTAGGGPTDCAGGSNDPSGTTGICLAPHSRIPCNEADRGAVVTLLDGNDELDYAGFSSANSYLTWNQATSSAACPFDGSVTRTSWGKMRKVYR